MLPDEKILRFAAKHHVLTLATLDDDGRPWCAHAFYAYDRRRNVMVFASSTDTRHGAHLALRPRVAASVAVETRIVGRVQGLQLTGEVAPADEAARTRYLERFPYAALAELTLWMLEPVEMKLTDNTLGFGKKLTWKRNTSE